MERAQAEFLTKTLNDFGVLLYVEVNGTQHRFKLRINELSPASVIYQRNREHIEDTEYTLVPITSAESIKNVGKKLFDPNLLLCYENRTHELTGFDYINTVFGRFFSRESIGKLDQIRERLTQEMRRRADELVGKRDYELYYRAAFLRAYRFFSAEMREFREQLKIMEGELHLFWEEVEKAYKDLAVIEASFARRGPKRHLRISDLDKPDLKTAYKLRNVPKSYDEYRAHLEFSRIITGFHELGFETWAWNENFWKVNDFKSARVIVFGRDSEAQVMLLDND